MPWSTPAVKHGFSCRNWFRTLSIWCSALHNHREELIGNESSVIHLPAHDGFCTVRRQNETKIDVKEMSKQILTSKNGKCQFTS